MSQHSRRKLKPQLTLRISFVVFKLHLYFESHFGANVNKMFCLKYKTNKKGNLTLLFLRTE